MNQQPDSAAPDPAVVFETLTAHQRTAAMLTAIEIDLFRAIGEGLHDAKSLAARCNASERGIRILCDYLVVIGLLGKTDGRFVHTPTSAMFLDSASPTSLAPMARFMGGPALQEPFRRLTEIVRTGRTVLPGQGTVEPENPVWVEFAHSMAPMMAPMTGPLAAVVLEGLPGPVRVLDIAAGHGLFGIGVATQNPAARIVALDWPAVLEVATGNARKAGVADRYQTLPGSAFDVEFGGPYDIVLLTNFLHHFDQPTNVALLTKVRRVLSPTGRAATLELVPNDDRVSPPMAAAFAMTMLGTTACGNAYTFAEYEGMYREAGFSRVTAHAIPRAPHTVITGFVG